MVLFLAACSPQLETDEVDQLGQGQAQLGGYSQPGTSMCQRVSLTGHVFYNDLRTHGRFADRRIPIFGTPGQPDPYASSYNKQNYLGLYEATVQVYETDSVTGAGCASTEYVGDALIQADGSWSWSGQVCDSCFDNEGPKEGEVSVAAKILLSNCFDPETRCFSVADPDDTFSGNHYDELWGGTDWWRWYRSAGAANPMRIGTSATRDLGNDYFQATAGLVAGDPDDLYAQAASVFASLADVTRQVHVVHGVDFDYAHWGKIVGYYPANFGGLGHSHQNGSDRLCIGLTPDEWQEGSTPAHEYGHMLNYWTWAKSGSWEGVGKWSSYCYDSDGDGVVSDDDCEQSSSQREYAANAFKEGWADFISQLTFTGGGGMAGTCEKRDGRTPTADTFVDHTGANICAPNQTCRQGRYFYNDVTSALCDLWDTFVDSRDGATDRLALPLTDMVEGLEVMFDEAGPDATAMVYATESEPITTSSLSICSYGDALVTGTVTETKVAETFAVTHLDCGGRWGVESQPVPTP